MEAMIVDITYTGGISNDEFDGFVAFEDERPDL